ncbi:hypothetical protein [Elongatibacter sediminis]|uniref:Thiamine-binding protein domain-containing protein n=1 Tax=Elongatibacter sediminis TaxID=3119006 RepID=A0AAW9R6L8_9GAMM
MIITAELSLYPLRDGAISTIVDFIHDLRGHLDAHANGGVEIVTNQLSTQLCGEYEAVTGAINICMRRVMDADGTVVVVVKYLNVDKPIGQTPRVD